MSITIFAQGTIEPLRDIPRLIDEVKGIAAERGWKYRVIDDDFDAQPDAVLTHRDTGNPGAVIEGSLGLKGIVLNVGQGVESLAILFDRSGVLTDMMQQLAWIENNRHGERFTMCKTQFGSIDSHIQMIELFDWLKEKYLSDLVVTDEGGYWESRDRRGLAEKRIFLSKCLRHTEKVINSIQLSEDDPRDADALADRIEEALLKLEDDETSHQ